MIDIAHVHDVNDAAHRNSVLRLDIEYRKNLIADEDEQGRSSGMHNKLAWLLRAGLLNSVYHGENSTRTLKELAHLYDCRVSDTTKLMNRIKALYRSRAVPCGSRDVYYSRNRGWLAKLPESGVRTRATFLYQELDHLRLLRRDAKNAILKRSRPLAWGLLARSPIAEETMRAWMNSPDELPARWATIRK